MKNFMIFLALLLLVEESFSSELQTIKMNEVGESREIPLSALTYSSKNEDGDYNVSQMESSKNLASMTSQIKRIVNKEREQEREKPIYDIDEVMERHRKRGGEIADKLMERLRKQREKTIDKITDEIMEILRKHREEAVDRIMEILKEVEKCSKSSIIDNLNFFNGNNKYKYSKRLYINN